MGLGTLITRTTDTVVAATTSAARAVTAATTSAAGATGGPPSAPDWGLCAAPPMVSGTTRKEEADQPPPPPSPSRRSPSPAFWTGRWCSPPSAPPFWSTGSPSTRPPRHHTRRPHAPGQGPPRSPAAAGRRSPAATLHLHLHLHLHRRRSSRLAWGHPGHPGMVGRRAVAHSEFSCSDRSWVASLTIRAANVPPARPHVPLTHRGTAHELCRTLSLPPVTTRVTAKRVYPR